MADSADSPTVPVPVTAPQTAEISVPIPAGTAPPLTFGMQLPWLTPLLFVVGGMLVGWVCERLVMSRIRALAARTAWKGDDVVVNGLKGLTFIWFVLMGIFAAVHFGHLEGRTEELAKNALKVSWILSLTFATARIAGSALRLGTERLGGAIASSTIFLNLVRIAIMLMGALVALDALGISITPILTALGVGGLAVALALQEPLANLFAGLQIVATKKVRIGDYVKLDSGDEGRVTDITWRNTAITTLANNTVIVPNAKLGSQVVTNYQMPDPQMSVTVQLGVGYDSDLDHVERVVIEEAHTVLAKVPGGVTEAVPVVRFNGFGDSSITLAVVLRVREFTDQFLLKHELIKHLHRRLRSEGIEIPYPIQTVIIKSPTAGPAAPV